MKAILDIRGCVLNFVVLVGRQCISVIMMTVVVENLLEAKETTKNLPRKSCRRYVRFLIGSLIYTVSLMICRKPCASCISLLPSTPQTTLVAHLEFESGRSSRIFGFVRLLFPLYKVFSKKLKNFLTSLIIHNFKVLFNENVIMNLRIVEFKGT